MADVDSHTDETSSVLAVLTANMTEVLNRASAPPQINSDYVIAPIGIKLDGSNYALWSQVVEMYISGNDKLGYINGDLPKLLKLTLPFDVGRLTMRLLKDG